jgi:hypothetical protein
LARSSLDPERPEPLQELADELRVVLVPVESRPDFREGLGDQLSAVARHRGAWRVTQHPEDSRWAFVGVATLALVISLLGLVVYLLRSRGMGKPQHAASH